MQTVSSTIREGQLLSYVIASSDMRYIEINGRDVWLREDPERGPVIRGEVPECGPFCDTDLAYILLEQSMSCEDCKDPVMTAAAVERFGERLGRTLVERLPFNHFGMPGIYRFMAALEVVLNSMNAEFTVQRTGGELRYELARCPLHETARKMALNRQVAMAHRSFVALCETILAAFLPDWTLVAPAERETKAPLLEIRFIPT